MQHICWALFLFFCLQLLSSSSSVIFTNNNNNNSNTHTHTPTHPHPNNIQRGMANANEIAKAFVQHYYNTFDTSRANLISLYQNDSMLTFEGQTFQGPQNIVNKLLSLPFQLIQHKPTTLDLQPAPGGGLIVFVSGQLLVDAEKNPMNFSQVFSLWPIQGSQGGFFVYNDMFRLNVG